MYGIEYDLDFFRRVSPKRQEADNPAPTCGNEARLSMAERFQASVAE